MPDDILILLWRFDEAKGSFLEDLSNLQNNGKLS